MEIVSPALWPVSSRSLRRVSPGPLFLSLKGKLLDQINTNHGHTFLLNAAGFTSRNRNGLSFCQDVPPAAAGQAAHLGDPRGHIPSCLSWGHCPPMEDAARADTATPARPQAYGAPVSSPAEGATPAAHSFLIFLKEIQTHCSKSQSVYCGLRANMNSLQTTRLRSPIAAHCPGATLALQAVLCTRTRASVRMTMPLPRCP